MPNLKQLFQEEETAFFVKVALIEALKPNCLTGFIRFRNFKIKVWQSNCIIRTKRKSQNIKIPKMKKLSLLFAFICFGLITSHAQRSAYVNMEQIMEAVPEYKEAQTELEQTAERWRQEITKKYDEIEQMYRDYQAREVLMSDEMRKQKQDEIIKKENQVRDLQKKRFGPEGEMFKKRQSLVKPVQEKVYKAIEKLAKDRNYDFIFTAPDGSTIIYAKADKDVTDDVIKRLGN